MSDKTKKIFFALTVVVPILLYCAYYYGMMIKNAPYRFSDFQYMRFEYGTGDTLKNKYDSKTGAYQYVTKSGAIKNMELHLTKDDLLYLHRKAADLGFWNFPEKEEGDGFGAGQQKAPKYMMEFVYKNKTKKVFFDASYAGDPDLKDANLRLIKEIQMKLDEREEQMKK